MSQSQFNSAGMDGVEDTLGDSGNAAAVVLRELLMIDMTDIGGDAFCITSQFQDGDDGTYRGFYEFQGNRFYYTPYESDGWEWSGNGSLPSPTITVADIQGHLLNDIYSYQNLIGAKVRRWIVRDENYFRGPEEFIVVQKMESTSSYHKFKLGTILAAMNKKVPGRNMLRQNFPGMQRLR